MISKRLIVKAVSQATTFIDSKLKSSSISKEISLLEVKKLKSMRNSNEISFSDAKKPRFLPNLSELKNDRAKKFHSLHQKPQKLIKI